MNIDLVPREAARGRAGPGHPRRGLIKLGSTAQLRHQEETGLGGLLSQRAPWAQLEPASWPAGQIRPLKFIAIQGAG